MRVPVHGDLLPGELKKPRLTVSRSPLGLSAGISEPPSTLNDSVKFLRSADCLHLLPELTDFENRHFGADFIWNMRNMNSWLASGCLFDAAVVREDATQGLEILSLASVLITGRLSYERLMRGALREHQMRPWSLEMPSHPPYLYFASIISQTTEHLLWLYRSLMEEIEQWLLAKQVQAYVGFSIAAGQAGVKHMSKNGFRSVHGIKYLHKYEIMRIDARTAQTEFWRRLLSWPPESSGLFGRVPTTVPSAHAIAAAPHSLP